MIVIIDPASTEFNRGSFAYLPYILFNSIQKDTQILEDFTVAEIDNIPKADLYLIALWSYPQIDACLVLHRFLKGKVCFFGYDPLIKHYGLPTLTLSDEMILNGLTKYPLDYYCFKHILLSDCDMHLSKYSQEQVYPLFTSYGCPKNCAFCPATVNQKKRIIVPEKDVIKMLGICSKGVIPNSREGYHNIHFTDEDFFFDIDRAHRILEEANKISDKWHFIALGEVSSVLRFIKKYTNEPLVSTRMKLIEIGLETANTDLGKQMGKAPIKQCEELAERCLVDIFWLNLTFFPGETITTLNETGEFMRKYGFKFDEVTSRMRTNGTQGGLGQFFQPYHGTKDYDKLQEKGVFLSNRPIRLIPSYVPHSFLDCKMKRVRYIGGEDLKWFELYNLASTFIKRSNSALDKCEGNTVRDLIGIWPNQRLQTDMLIFIAICTKLGIIKEE